MKKYLFVFLYVITSVHVSAQLEVNSSGKVGIKTSGSILSSLSINSSGATEFELYTAGTQKGIHSNVNNSPGSSWGTAIEGFANDNSSTYRAGVHGSAYNNSSVSGRTYGVLGRAGGASGNRNYAIFGQLVKTTNGAAIYGTTTATDFGVSIDNRYAGYFSGPVKVTGVLTVNGGINGVLLSQSSNGNNSSFISKLSENNRGCISRLLQNIEAHTYYLENEKSQAQYSDSLRDNTPLTTDTIECDVKESTIERQVFSKHHYGLSAEQLEEVFPDLVYEQEDGTKSINYVEMVPILVQALNELSAKVASLEGDKDGSEMRARQQTTDVDRIDENIISLSLGQNKPNPFSNATTIEVCIPEDVQKAFIYVYDLQGKKVEQVDITARGKQNIQLTSAYLTDGMYLYSFIADGKVVETRRMIVEK